MVDIQDDFLQVFQGSGIGKRAVVDPLKTTKYFPKPSLSSQILDPNYFRRRSTHHKLKESGEKKDDQ